MRMPGGEPACRPLHNLVQESARVQLQSLWASAWVGQVGNLCAAVMPLDIYVSLPGGQSVQHVCLWRFCINL